MFDCTCTPVHPTHRAFASLVHNLQAGLRNGTINPTVTTTRNTQTGLLRYLLPKPEVVYWLETERQNPPQINDEEAPSYTEGEIGVVGMRVSDCGDVVIYSKPPGAALTELTIQRPCDISKLPGYSTNQWPAIPA